ncbi:hypothetical protein RR48_00711 [Papilio machaon]|uniref:Uncharacterized protein n=1 Tax=Papilio machaon TaxID=76193 RepID=A0A0N1PIH2_PAPMA|nr:hypothetical protein RR48_00711 [Papilio machaon]
MDLAYGMLGSLFRSGSRQTFFSSQRPYPVLAEELSEDNDTTNDVIDIKTQASVPHVRPETPRQLTHTHDDDCSDDEDVAKNNTNKDV